MPDSDYVDDDSRYFKMADIDYDDPEVEALEECFTCGVSKISGVGRVGFKMFEGDLYMGEFCSPECAATWGADADRKRTSHA